MLFEILLRLFIFQQLRGSLFPLILRYILKLAGQVIALVDGQFLLIKRLLDGVRSILVDLYDLAHRAFAQTNCFGQLLAGIYRFFNRRKVWQCCRTFLGLAGAEILSASSHVGFGLGFNLWF